MIQKDLGRDFFAHFLGKCKQVIVQDFELDNFLDELDKTFQWLFH